MASILRCDLAIVGGGLAGALIALALAERRPDCDVRLIEQQPGFGGNHVWSFFGSDIDSGDRWLLTALVCHSWPAYDVAFPAHRRTIATPYYAIESERLDAVLRTRIAPERLLTGRRVLGASPTAVVLADGDRIEAGGVIDARGAGELACLETGWQKFLGRELELAAPHERQRPVVMDATVGQADGYRFVYTLPFAADRMFVEDTYYSDTPDLDPTVLARRINAYAAAQDWQIRAVLREETGVLPVTLDGDFEGYWRSGGNKVAKAGMRAGLFHPTTGYSLPDAVRLASAIARANDLSGAALHDLTHRTARTAWQKRGFYRMLDRMLFRAADPDERYRILQRFYRLHPRLIGRFYAGRSTLLDKARVLTGKPPVPIARAIAAIRRRT